MQENIDNNKPIKNRKRLSKFFDILFVVFIVLSFALSGVLIYQRRYLTPFWVNGQSMYPTLNHDLFMENNPNAGGINGGSTQVGAKKVDYGVMDEHKSTLKKLKRFDIIVTSYSSQDNDDAKIKRIIGLPGETIKFTSTSSSDPHNGDLYVKSGDSFKFIEQPIPNEFKAAGDEYPSTEIVLKENEYYVLGDNRYPGRSRDSRSIGPIKFDWIIGKAIAIAGYCEVGVDEYGVATPTNIHYFLWPRFL